MECFSSKWKKYLPKLSYSTRDDNIIVTRTLLLSILSDARDVPSDVAAAAVSGK